MGKGQLEVPVFTTQAAEQGFSVISPTGKLRLAKEDYGTLRKPGPEYSCQRCGKLGTRSDLTFHTCIPIARPPATRQVAEKCEGSSKPSPLPRPELPPWKRKKK